MDPLSLLYQKKNIYICMDFRVCVEGGKYFYLENIIENLFLFLFQRILVSIHFGKKIKYVFLS